MDTDLFVFCGLRYRTVRSDHWPLGPSSLAPSA